MALTAQELAKDIVVAVVGQVQIAQSYAADEKLPHSAKPWGKCTRKSLRL
jgi:hypothetical protein